jgi:hypothetical protein
MTLDLTCQACDTSFELDATELLDEPRIQCPSCDVRAPLQLSEGLSNAIEDVLGRVARLRGKFQVVFEIDSDDLPPPFDTGGRRSAAADEDDEDDEDEVEDLEGDGDEPGDLERDSED